MSIEAQPTFKVKVDSFFNFKFQKSISAPEALNTKNYIELIGNVGLTEIYVNEFDSTISVKFDDELHTLYITEISVGEKHSYKYHYKEGDKVVYAEMSFVYGSDGFRYVLAECQDEENPEYMKARIAKIK